MRLVWIRNAARVNRRTTQQGMIENQTQMKPVIHDTQDFLGLGHNFGANTITRQNQYFLRHIHETFAIADKKGGDYIKKARLFRDGLLVFRTKNRYELKLIGILGQISSHSFYRRLHTGITFIPPCRANFTMRLHKLQRFKQANNFIKVPTQRQIIDDLRTHQTVFVD
jgi:hypothetical protein